MKIFKQIESKKRSKTDRQGASRGFGFIVFKVWLAPAAPNPSLRWRSIDYLGGMNCELAPKDEVCVLSHDYRKFTVPFIVVGGDPALVSELSQETPPVRRKTRSNNV